MSAGLKRTEGARVEEEAVMEGLEQHRRRAEELRKPEEKLGLRHVGHGWLLQEDMLAGADGTGGPLIVQTGGQRDEERH